MDAIDERPGWLTPAEMVERTGVSIDTLRYYEKEDLITEVARADSGHRRYHPDDVEWVEILRCLRLTGMSIRQMKAFAALVQAGDHTRAQRYEQLVEHRRQVRSRMDELETALAVIDTKTSTYQRLLEEDGLL